MVTNSLSALTRQIAGAEALVAETPFNTSCTFASSGAAIRTVKSCALPLKTYTPASVISQVCPFVAVICTASPSSAVCSRSRSVKRELPSSTPPVYAVNAAAAPFSPVCAVSPFSAVVSAVCAVVSVCFVVCV